MGRVFEAFFPVADVGNVGYSLIKRGRTWTVCFNGPSGEYLRISTGAKEKNTATVEAAKIVLRTYRPELSARPTPVTWDDFADHLRRKLTANNNRHATYRDYVKTLNVLRATLPEAKGPADVTPGLAEAFKERYISTTYRKTDGGSEYARSHRTLNAYLRKARSLWSKWLIKTLKLATTNPWLTVDYAEVARARPVAPAEGSLTEFLKWVRTTYPDWSLPVLFVQVKALIGCRLTDLCQLRSDQLTGGYLYLDAEQLKTDNPRRVKLPEALYQSLQAIKGPTFAWESYPAGLRACLKKQQRRANKVRPEFTPEALYWFVQSLFRTFNAAHPEHRLKSHGLRKRAISEIHAQGIDVDRAAKMLGMDPQTARLYYHDLDRVDTDADFAKVADKLLPT